MSTSTRPWADRTLPTQARVDLLLAAMTHTDQASLVLGDMAGLAAFGLPTLERVDASCGLRGDSGITAFAAPIALAAAFDPQLAYNYGAAIGSEARAHGWSIILGPTLDVERRGNSGRLAEGYGEDPLLNGIIGERVSRGIQDQHLIPVLKHYTAYFREIERHALDVRVSSRALHEIYNAPFHAALTAGSAQGVMGAYPRVNGVFSCENAALMNDLRAETGWRGFMMPDYFAGEDPVAGMNAGIDSATLYPTFPRAALDDGRVPAVRLREAAARTLFAIFASGLFDDPVGALDQSLPVSTPAHKALAARVAVQGMVLLKNARALLPLDRASLGSLAVIGCAREDMLTGPEGSSFVRPDARVTALQAITEATGAAVQVLFAQGSHGDHPLPAIPSSAFVSPDGSRAGLHGSFYDNASFEGSPLATHITPSLDFDGAPAAGLPATWFARWVGKLIAPASGWFNFSILCTGRVSLRINGSEIIAGARDSISFVTNGHHYPLHGRAQLRAGEAVDIVVELSSPHHHFHSFLGKHLRLGWQHDELVEQAVQVAARAASAVVIVNHASGEGMDRDTLDLPANQNHLIDCVCAANPNTVVVLNTPGAVLMPWIDKAAAVLQLWYPGEAEGSALAAVLFGDAEPGGRLPLTFPASNQQLLPDNLLDGRLDCAEGVNVGYRHFLRHQHAPLFSFGHGLSYTQFSQRELEATALPAPAVARVQVTVQNTGRRAGSEVVQVYAGALPCAMPTPPRQLVGFARVWLEAGATETVVINIPQRLLSYWDETLKRFVMPAGQLMLYAGASLADAHLSCMLELPQRAQVFSAVEPAQRAAPSSAAR